ncbi:unnamed protein product [Peronospora belbahrii]|uniref:BZIP domain-containing protein n=1 Tax=Peronospora belbahrii TaxID=622444 RepID=A0ABN8D5N6_9STRA|nr:unnamed protein product [Peronospora belbahrii]
MDTPPSIRQQYAAPPHETPAERRRRLVNRRAAKYRHYRSLNAAQNVSDPVVEFQRQQNSRRQRERRSLLDDEARDRLRAQNQRRQQLRRNNMSDVEKAEIREKQRARQRQRRQKLDDDARDELRERERLRITRRRRHMKALEREKQAKEPVLLLPAQFLQPALTETEMLPHLRLAPELPTLRQHQEQQRQREMQGRAFPFVGGLQSTLPPPPPVIERVRAFQHERIPSLPHLQQVTRPATTSLLHITPPPIFTISETTGGGSGIAASTGMRAVASAVVAATRPPPQPTPIIPSVSLPLANNPLTALSMVPQQQQQSRTPIVLPPAHRSLPPLPDFLNSREAFNPAAAGTATATSTRVSRPSSSATRALFPSITDLPPVHTDASDVESFLQR